MEEILLLRVFGDPKNLLTGFITVAIILALQVWGKGFIKSIAVLVGLIAEL